MSQPVQPLSQGQAPSGAPAAMRRGSTSAADMLKKLEDLDTLSTAEQHLMRSLDACENRAFAAAVRRLLDNDQGLTALRLRKCQLGDSEATMLADGLVSNTHCVTVDLRDNNIGHFGGRRLAGMLSTNTTITELRFENNNIANKTVVCIKDRLVRNKLTNTFRRLEANDPHLLDLDLAAVNAGAETCERLASALQHNTTLRTLHLKGNNVGERGACALEAPLRDPACALMELDLDNNMIGSHGFEALCRALHCNNTLQHLSFGDNDIREAGAHFLADALRHNSSLTRLDLQNNSIGDEGIRAIMAALMDTSCDSRATLQPVRAAAAMATVMQHARATVDVAKHSGAMTDVTEGAMTNSGAPLRELNLRGNAISAHGAKCLADWLLDNRTLVSLNLIDNPLGATGGLDLVKALSHNMTLEHLLFTKQNGMGEESNFALNDIVARNRLLPLFSRMLESKFKRRTLRQEVEDARANAKTLRSRLGPIPEMVQERLRMLDKTIESKCDEILVSTKDARVVDLKCQGAGDITLKYACEQLRIHYAVRVLNLNDNMVGPAGAALIAQLYGAVGAASGPASPQSRANKLTAQLQATPAMRTPLLELLLENNKLGDVGAASIANALASQSCVLRVLELGGNNITPEGAAALARAMNHNYPSNKVPEFDEDSGEEDEDRQTAHRRQSMVKSASSRRQSMDMDVDACSNATLRVLGLSSNVLGDAGADVIINALRSNRVLKQINVTANSISKKLRVTITDLLARNHLDTIIAQLLATQAREDTVPGTREKEGMEPVDHEEEHAEPATALDLQLKGIGDEAILALVKGLRKDKHVSMLDLRANSITTLGVKHLIACLDVNCTLTDIKLAQNRGLSRTLVEELKDKLQRNKLEPVLKFVDLNDEEYAAACGGILDFRMRGLGPFCMKRLGVAIRNNETMSVLDLNSNDLRDKGIENLTSESHGNETLQTLIVSKNNIGEFGARHMAAMFSSLALTELNVSHNHLGDLGACHMAKALTTAACQLKSFDLSYNDITDNGTIKLAESLTTNTVLQVFALDGNRVSDEGAVHLARMLQRNSTLQVLRLRNTDIGKRGEGWLGRSTGGFQLGREVLLRSFDPLKSFGFTSEIGERSAQVQGPGGKDHDAMMNNLLEHRRPSSPC